MKVDVYFNLHKKKLSVRSCSTKRVVAHVDEIILDDAVFRVNERGRQRVLSQKRKNVHAYVRGVVADTKKNGMEMLVTYNPYKYIKFVDTETKTPVFESQQACISGRVIKCIGNSRK